MSQYQQNPYGGPEDQMASQPRKTSGLAITALISSLIFCCPLTTLLGILLGVIAFFMIGGNPQKKGRGLAAAAVILGLIFTVGQGAAFYWAKVNFADIEQAGPGESIVAASNGDYPDFRSAMYGSAAQATDSEIESFVTEIESRYGAFKTSYFDRTSFAPPTSAEEIFNPEQTRPYIFEFENATMQGEATLAASDPGSGQFLGGYKFGSITIFDPDLGDITFPVDVTTGGAGAGDADGDGDDSMNGGAVPEDEAAEDETSDG